MSRRHKEKETDNSKPRQVGSQGDSNLRVKRFTISSASLLNTLTVTTKNAMRRFSVAKIAESISESIANAFVKKDIEVDDEFVKIPRSHFKLSALEFLSKLISESALEPIVSSEERPHKGHPLLKRLIDEIEDSKVVSWFKSALAEVKKTGKKLYRGLTQFSTCFLKGIHEAFCPRGDTNGKVSHYHRMLSPVIPNFPARVTIDRNLRWFVNWQEEILYEDAKAKKNREKHWLWEKLVNWIRSYLLELAPQYAA